MTSIIEEITVFLKPMFEALGVASVDIFDYYKGDDYRVEGKTKPHVVIWYGGSRFKNEWNAYSSVAWEDININIYITDQKPTVLRTKDSFLSSLSKGHFTDTNNRQIFFDLVSSDIDSREKLKTGLLTVTMQMTFRYWHENNTLPGTVKDIKGNIGTITNIN